MHVVMHYFGRAGETLNVVHKSCRIRRKEYARRSLVLRTRRKEYARRSLVLRTRRKECVRRSLVLRTRRKECAWLS